MNETDCALRTGAQSSELRQHATSKACRGAAVAACTVTISYYWSIRKQRLRGTRCHSCQPTVQPPFRGVEVGPSSAWDGTCARRVGQVSHVEREGEREGESDVSRLYLISPVCYLSKAVFPFIAHLPEGGRSEEQRSGNSACQDVHPRS